MLAMSASMPPAHPSHRVESKAPSIRMRLTLLVLACVVPVSLMVAAWVMVDYEKDRQQLIQDSISRAAVTVSVVDRELAGTKAALIALASSPYIANEDWQAFYGQAQEVQAALNVNSIVLVDRSFAQRMNTLREFGAPLPIDSHAWLKSAFDSGLPMTTDMFLGATAAKPVIAVSVPVLRDNHAKYVLFAAIGPERLSRLLTREKLPYDWIATVFDSTGTIVARTRNEEKFVGTKGTPALVARMREKAEDSLENKTLEGIPVIAVFSRSAVSNFTVALGIPSHLLLDELYARLWWIIGITALVLAASLAMAWHIAGKIARSIHGLSSAARLIGNGNENVVLEPLGLREADDVGEALNLAAAKLVSAEHRAYHDGLTGLPNRMLFHEIANMQLEVSKRDGTGISVLFIDLDGFKRVNDDYGHQTGDSLLCDVASRLRATLRHSDIAARLGGDEFAALLIHTNIAQAAQVAGKLVDSISAPYRIGHRNVEISASIGISTYPDSGTTSEDLLRHADEAMYKVKFGGKRGYAVSAQSSKTPVDRELVAPEVRIAAVGGEAAAEKRRKA
jgi:diguanylate cyclase (GGDEF)-like protein